MPLAEVKADGVAEVATELCEAYAATSAAAQTEAAEEDVHGPAAGSEATADEVPPALRAECGLARAPVVVAVARPLAAGWPTPLLPLAAARLMERWSCGVPKEAAGARGAGWGWWGWLVCARHPFWFLIYNIVIFLPNQPDMVSNGS